MGKVKESPAPKPPKVDKKKAKKEEKKRKKELKKSTQSLADGGEGGDATYATASSEPRTPKLEKKEKKKKVESPSKDSMCSTGKKKSGLFKKIGSFMLPSSALAPASPTVGERIGLSQSCADLPGRSPPSPRSGVPSVLSEPGLRSNSISSPNLFNSPPTSSPPPVRGGPPPTTIPNNTTPLEHSLSAYPGVPIGSSTPLHSPTSDLINSTSDRVDIKNSLSNIPHSPDPCAAAKRTRTTTTGIYYIPADLALSEPPIGSPLSEPPLESPRSEAPPRPPASYRNLVVLRSNSGKISCRVEDVEDETTGGGHTPGLETPGGDQTPGLETPAGGQRPGLETAAGGQIPGLETTGGGQRPGLDTTGGGHTPGLETTAGGQRPGLETAGGGQRPGLETAADNQRPGLETAGGGQILELVEEDVADVEVDNQVLTTELRVEEVLVEPVLSLNAALRSSSACSVEYSVPHKYRGVSGDVPVQHLSFSSDEETGSPRYRSSMKSPLPSPRKDRRISFANDEYEHRVTTPEILKKDLAAELGVPNLPADMTTAYLPALDIPEPSDLEDLPLEERCEAQSKLLHTYQEEIHNIRDQVLEIVSEKSRLQRLVAENGVQDIQTVQKQAEQVLQENRALIKEQQMNQARWQELIEERNSEVLRIRAICSNMEEQNSTLLKRCNKLDDKNEELRDAYNSIVSSATSADDFVPVQAHLSSIEGYKVALEELRKRYDDNVYDKEEDIGNLEKNVQQLTEKIEILEGEKSLLCGQCKGLTDSLERAQHSSARHKREVAHLTKRVNTLKTSLAQAINIAEQSTLQKLELAEILQISDLQEKQKRSYLKSNTENKVKEVKKIANAKLKSCAEILQERETEHEKSISVLQDKIAKLRLRNKEKDDIILNSDRTISN